MKPAILYLTSGQVVVVDLGKHTASSVLATDRQVQLTVCYVDPRMPTDDLFVLSPGHAQAVMLFDLEAHRTAWLQDRGLYMDAAKASVEAAAAAVRMAGPEEDESDA